MLQFPRPTGRTAGLLVLALMAVAPAAQAAGPASVTVRVEGASGTLVEPNAISTSTAPVNKSGEPGEACTGTSAAGALEVATGGDWAGTYSPGFSSYSVDRIRQERYVFGNADGDYWSFWVNDRAATTGVCQAELQEGDDVLFFVDRCLDAQPPDFACKNQPVRPLRLFAPAGGRTDAPVTVSVVALDGNGGSVPAARAEVSGPGVRAVTGADGRALVRFGQSGQIALKAERAGSARSAAVAVAVAAADGGALPAAPAAPAAPGGDETAPVARIAGVRDGRHYTRRRAPRTLRGSVAADPSGLRAVKLSLTRSSGGHCQLYSSSRERFRGSRCGRRVYFRIGDRQDWSYLLPSRLKRGRYVLDVVAVDKAGNRDAVVRGRNRAVFFVR